jgi:hypothetical protein
VIRQEGVLNPHERLAVAVRFELHDNEALEIWIRSGRTAPGEPKPPGTDKFEVATRHDESGAVLFDVDP